MSDDPVKEFRRIREENARRHGFDAQAMGRTFMRHQKKSGHVIVDRRTMKPAETRSPLQSTSASARQGRTSVSKRTGGLAIPGQRPAMKDEIMEEIWATKDRLGARFGGDVKKYLAHLRKLDAANPLRTARPKSPRKAKKTA